jgi:hypothetical protein
VEAFARLAPVDQFDATDLDDTVSLRGIESGCLGIEDYFAH